MFTRKKEKQIKDLSNQEIETTMSLIKEEQLKRKNLESEKMVEKPKMKIPFPMVGVPQPPENKVEVVKEYEEQQKQIDVELEEKYANSLTCNHAIHQPIFFKTQLMLCGHCHKAIYIAQHDKWIMFDREFEE